MLNIAPAGQLCRISTFVWPLCSTISFYAELVRLYGPYTPQFPFMQSLYVRTALMFSNFLLCRVCTAPMLCNLLLCGVSTFIRPYILQFSFMELIRSYISFYVEIFFSKFVRSYGPYVLQFPFMWS